MSNRFQNLKLNLDLALLEKVYIENDYDDGVIKEAVTVENKVLLFFSQRGNSRIFCLSDFT